MATQLHLSDGTIKDLDTINIIQAYKRSTGETQRICILKTADNDTPLWEKHDFPTTPTYSVPATCQTTGIKGYVCNWCNVEKVETEGKTSHKLQASYVNGIVVYICTVCGASYSVDIPTPTQFYLSIQLVDHTGSGFKLYINGKESGTSYFVALDYVGSSMSITPNIDFRAKLSGMGPFIARPGEITWNKKIILSVDDNDTVDGSVGGVISGFTGVSAGDSVIVTITIYK